MHECDLLGSCFENAIPYIYNWERRNGENELPMVHLLEIVDLLVMDKKIPLQGLQFEVLSSNGGLKIGFSS